MLTVKIKTANAAFENKGYSECARLLRQIADKLDIGTDEGTVMDVNDNKVGTFKLTNR